MTAAAPPITVGVAGVAGPGARARAPVAAQRRGPTVGRAAVVRNGITSRSVHVPESGAMAALVDLVTAARVSLCDATGASLMTAEFDDGTVDVHGPVAR